MKIRIQDDAVQDLIEGFRFYEKLEPGLGAYFTDSLFSDIDSLSIYANLSHWPSLPGSSLKVACPPQQSSVQLK